METKYHYSYDFDTNGWDSINTFDDAIDLNIEFLEGKKKSTPYHAAPVYDIDVSKLLYIHKKGRIITTDGQSNLCEYDTFIPEKRHIYLYNDKIEEERIIPEQTISSEQKSYLQGFMERKHFRSFMSFLKRNKDKIAYHVYDINKNKSYYSGYNKRTRWLTRYKINNKNNNNNRSEWTECTWAPKEPDLYSLYDNFLSRTMTPQIFFMIFSIKPCDLNIEDILIMYIDRNRNQNQKPKKKTKKKSKKSKKKSKKNTRKINEPKL